MGLGDRWSGLLDEITVQGRSRSCPLDGTFRVSLPPSRSPLRHHTCQWLRRHTRSKKASVCIRTEDTGTPRAGRVEPSGARASLAFDLSLAQIRPQQQPVDRSSECLVFSVAGAVSGDQHDVPATLYFCRSNCRLETPTDPVAFNRVSKPLAHGKSKSGNLSVIRTGVKDDHRVRPTSASPPNGLEV